MLKKSDVFILSALHNNDYKNAQPIKVKTLINFIPKYFFGFGDFKATSVIIHLLFNYQRYALHMRSSGKHINRSYLFSFISESFKNCAVTALC